MRRKGSLSLTVEEIERAKSLSALGRSFRAIGRELGRSAHTVKKALTGSAQVVEEVKARKADLADLFEQRSRETLDAVTKSDVEKASLLQKATSAAIFLDKSRLLRGESTVNLSVDVLLSIARQLRDESDREDAEDDHTRTITLPTVQAELPEHADTCPILESVPVKAQESVPTPTVRVRYYAPNPIEKPDNTNPLEHGLFVGKT